MRERKSGSPPIGDEGRHARKRPVTFRIVDHSSSIGGFAERQGSTKLTPRGLPIYTAESERGTFEAGFKSMPQGFTATLDQFADGLAKACIFGAYAGLLARRRVSESGQNIPKIAQREA